MHLIEILDSLDYNLSNIYIIYLNELTDEEVLAKLENGLDYLYFLFRTSKINCTLMTMTKNTGTKIS